MSLAKNSLALLVLFLGSIAFLNYRALNQIDDGRPAAAVLGVAALSLAVRADVLALDLPQLAQLFRSLGREPSKIEPRGTFRGEQLELGLTGLAGAGVITRLGMGVCWGACLGSQSHLGPWAGKWFDAADEARGGNLFQQPGGPVSKARPFRVERRHVSQLDGRPATQLHYGVVDLPLLGFMRDEVRCVHGDLCVGFGGFNIAGGVRVSGSPFLLQRMEVGSGAAVEAGGPRQDEL